MSERALRWYLAISIVFLVGVAVVLVVRLSVLREERFRQAQSQFLSLSPQLAHDWSSPADQDRLRGLVDRIKRDPAVRVIGVFRPDSKYDYLWARDADYLPGDLFGDSPTIIDSVHSVRAPAFVYDQLTEVQLSQSFVKDGSSHVVVAVYKLLDRSSIYPLLRDTLIALLSFALFAVVVAVVNTARREAKNGVIVRHGQPASSVRAGQQSVRSTAKSDEDGRCKDGLSDETALPRKLTLELERSAFNEQDFSVAVVEFSGVSRSDSVHAQVADAVLDFFSFEDLIFAFGENQIVVLFPATSLTDTLATLERFQRHVWKIRADWGKPDTEFFAGASSRNGRLIDGPRILHESETALRQAYDSRGHIVGFNPDADRFRSYLKGEA